MEKRSSLYALLVFGSLLGLCFIFLFALFANADKGDTGIWTSKNGPRIGVVELTGEISDSREFVGILHEMRKDKTLKAILVRIDSPGGSVGPSQEMYAAIVRAR